MRAGVLQCSAQVAWLIGLKSAQAEGLYTSERLLFGLESIKEKLHFGIYTVLGQSETVARSSNVELIDQSDQDVSDLLEICLTDATVHQEENVCKLFCQRCKLRRKQSFTIIICISIYMKLNYLQV